MYDNKDMSDNLQFSTITPLHSHSNCQTYLYSSVKILERRSNAELWKMARRLIEYIVLMS